MEGKGTRLYLARHGEVVNHGIYNGHTDVDMSSTGLAQMDRLRTLLQDRNLEAVYCSDLTRTKKGAGRIAEPHGIVPEEVPQFRELHFGRWQGLTLAEVQQKYPDDFPQWMQCRSTFRIPGGESFQDLRHRALPKLQELIEKHRGGEFAVVCHGVVNRILLAEALQLSYDNLLRIEQDYGCLNMVEYYPDWAVVKLMNG
jgi:alpha-ribazole phosphatase